METVENLVLQNKYEIVSKIKQGGFGIVYFGVDRVFEKPVAIKAIEPTLLNDAKYVELFLQEAKNAAKLSHNNIARIYDLVKDEQGQIFLIMEFIDGYDLGKILRQCKKKHVILPIDLSVFIVKEVCKALEYAHNKRDVLTNKPLKLVHLDISPSNLMISLSGQVKLIDFGLAKIRYQKDKSDHVIVSGKLPYLAPEQINGSAVDRRTDIYSLGVIFYEMLTNTRLVEATDPKEAIQKIKKHRVDPAILDKHNVPQPVQKVLLKMLNKNPEERYFGANGVYLDLVDYLMTSAHSVELSEELEAYLQELYKDTDSHIPLVEDQSESKMNIEPIPTEITRTEKVTADSMSAKEETKKSEHEIVAADSGDDGKQLPPVADDDRELEKILSEIETIFSDEEETAASTLDEKKKPSSSSEPLLPKTISRLKSEAVSPTISGTAPEKDEEDDLKTVIDVIRLSTKRHSRMLKRLGVGFIILLISLVAVDTAFQFTPLGKGIFNLIFPPAIKISSVPSGAVVYLNEVRLPGETPLSIAKIAPGVHQLTLIHSGYRPIVKSIQVPAKGKITILGENANKGSRAYVFRFKTRIELSSDPLGGTVYINNVRYPHKTPTSIEWEAGVPLTIAMEHEGYGRLSGFTLKGADGAAEISDHRFWSFEKFEQPLKRFSIKGNFKKFISLETLPAQVTFFVDGATEPSGQTGESNTLALSVGKHEILFKKEGYNDKLVSITVDENGPDKIYVALDRMVHFSAVDKISGDPTDINAKIVKYIQNDNSYTLDYETPCQFSLPAGELSLYLQKHGYKETVVQVGPNDKNIIVEMEVTNVPVEVFVHDALTELPLNNAKITYQVANDSSATVMDFGITDENGKCVSTVLPREYRFTVNRAGYYSKDIVLDTGKGNNKIDFRLIIK